MIGCSSMENLRHIDWPKVYAQSVANLRSQNFPGHDSDLPLEKQKSHCFSKITPKSHLLCR